MIFGIDVSRWQGVIQWGAVRDGGDISFAIARATYGTETDALYRSNAKGARSAGMLLGAYCFIYPDSLVSPESQADKFLQVVGDPSGMLLAVDVERDRSGLKPTARDARRFVERLRTRGVGGRILVYTGAWYWKGVIGDPDGSLIGPLWDSFYAAPQGQSITATYRSVTSRYWSREFGGWDSSTRPLLQFSSGVKVAGVSGPVDANAFRGTIAELRKYAVDVDVEPPETPTADVLDLGLCTYEVTNLVPLTCTHAVDVKAGTVLSAGGQRYTQLAEDATLGLLGGKGDWYHVADGDYGVWVERSRAQVRTHQMNVGR